MYDPDWRKETVILYEYKTKESLYQFKKTKKDIDEQVWCLKQIKIIKERMSLWMAFWDQKTFALKQANKQWTVLQTKLVRQAYESPHFIK